MPLQKHTIIKLLTLLIVIFSTAQLRSETINTSLSDSTKLSFLMPSQLSLNDSIVNYGKMFLNTPYHYGAQGADTFDCSGFTSYVYRNFGYNLHRSSEDQAQQFDTVKREQLKIGDLVFFSGRRRSESVGHVGIVVGAKETGEFDFIHAAVRNGVIISNSQEAYYQNRFIKANRVIGGVERQLLTQNNLQKSDSTVNDGFTQSIISEPTQHTRKIIPAKYHRVKSGETLSSIALKYGLSINDLKHKNGIVGSKINIKQQLKVKDKETIMMIESVRTLAKNSSEPTVKKGIENKIAADSANLAKTSIAINHIVKKGESLFSLSKTYNISTEELIQINNLKSEGIQIGQELKISQQKDNRTSESIQKDDVASISKTNKLEKTIKHKVQKGESLYVLSQMYKISTNDLKTINNLNDYNIQAGQELLVNIANTETVEVPATTKTKAKSLTHRVKEGESLYLISKKYNVSTNELKEINKLESDNIHPGQKLMICYSEESTSPTKISKNKSKEKSITHVVKHGDSFYSISKKYSCSIDKLKEWNNNFGDRINIGDKITIYTNEN